MFVSLSKFALYNLNFVLSPSLFFDPKKKAEWFFLNNYDIILKKQGISSTLKMSSSLVAQVSAGSSVVDGVNMVNPVLKKNDRWGRKMSQSDTWKQSSTKLKFTFHMYEDK